MTITATLMLCLLLAPPSAQTPKAEVTLVADADAFEPGVPMTVGLRFELQPTWHVYWINPGDAGLPPRVDWELPEGFTAGPLMFPVPKTFESAGSVGYGYADEVTYLARITPPSELPDGPVTLSAKVRYLICDPSLCIPENANVSIELGIGEPAEKNLLADAAAELPKSAAEAGFTIDGKPGTGTANLIWIDRERGVAADTDFQVLPAPEENLFVKNVEVGELERNLMNGEHTLPITIDASRVGALQRNALDVLLIWTDAEGTPQHYELSLPYRLILD